MQRNNAGFNSLWHFCALVLFMMVLFGVSITPAQAAEFTVSTPAELIAAIQSANDNTEADTIRLTGDIEMNCQMRMFNADGGNSLPSITSEIAIIGNGFTISRTPTIRCRIFHVAAGGNLALNNVTISNGHAGGSDAPGLSGGGIYNRGTVTMINTTLSDNIAAYGGAVHNNNGTVTIINSTISAGLAVRGAGIENNSGTVTIINSTISDNEAQTALLNGIGGGIFNEGTLTITNSTISNNVAQVESGGVANEGNMTITNSTISGNSATEFIGGGITNNDDATLTISNSTISNNSSATAGGIFNNDDSTLTISNSTITGNSVSVVGGGMVNFGAATITNSTISGNSSVINAGGIFHNVGTATLRNSIVTGNTSPDDADCAGSIDGGNNIIGQSGDAGGCPTTGNTILAGVTGTLIGSLANNGGLTQTHALVAGSPAINASGTGATTTDQRGVPVQGSTRDIGAFEFGVAPTYPTVQFASAGATYDEDAGTVTITLNIAGAANFRGIAQIYVADTGTGTGASGADYTAFPLATVTIDCTIDCPLTQTISLDILTDAVLFEPDETVNLQIVATNGFATIGAQNTFTAIIQDATTTTATITATTPTASFSPLVNGQFTVDLGAVNETGAPITINYNVGGTATAGTDYNALAGSVAVPDGQQTATLDVIPLLGTVGATIEVTLTGASNVNVNVDVTPAIVTITTTPSSSGDGGVTGAPSGDNPANSPDAWDIQITSNTQFVIQGQEIIFTITVRKLLGGTPVQVEFPVSTGFTILSATSNRGSVDVNGQLVTYTDDIHVGDVGIITVITQVGANAQAGTSQACITTPVTKCASLNLFTIMELPQTGETPAWAVKLRQLFALE